MDNIIPSNTQESDVDDNNLLADLVNEVSSSTRSMSMSKEIAQIMFAHGDDIQPHSESVELMENIVGKFLADTCRETMNVGRSDKLTLDAIMYYFRKDLAKLQRTQKLIEERQNLKQIRRVFDTDFQ